MGVYAQKISGLFRGKKEEKIKLTGESFEINTEHTARFQVWWRRVNAEHAMIFWGVGVVSIVLLMLLSFSTTFVLALMPMAYSLWINEGMILKYYSACKWSFVFVVVSLMLFKHSWYYGFYKQNSSESRYLLAISDL
jgi:Zn-dependent protease with chaperone function